MSRVIETGALAYLWAAFSGPLPCKVVSVTGTSGTPSGAQEVTVKLTADRGPYKRGEVLTERGENVVPRDLVHVRNGKFELWGGVWSVRVDG